MERFLWLDGTRVVNLDAIAYFEILKGERVRVAFRETHTSKGASRIMHIDGVDGARLSAYLRDNIDALRGVETSDPLAVPRESFTPDVGIIVMPRADDMEEP